MLVPRSVPGPRPPRPNQATYAYRINSSGQIVGFTVEANLVSHSFVFSDGHYTTFDAPDAGTEVGQGTTTAGIGVPAGTARRRVPEDQAPAAHALFIEQQAFGLKSLELPPNAKSSPCKLMPGRIN